MASTLSELKDTFYQQGTPCNILFVGLPRTGKGATINSVNSVLAGYYKPIANVAAKLAVNETLGYIPLESCCIKGQTQDNHELKNAKPFRFFDTRGLPNFNTDEVKSFLRNALRGAIEPRADLKELKKVKPRTPVDSDKIHVVIFIHSFTLGLPSESLAKATKDVCREEGVAIYYLATHKDEYDALVGQPQKASADSRFQLVKDALGAVDHTFLVENIKDTPGLNNNTIGFIEILSLCQAKVTGRNVIPNPPSSCLLQ